MFALMRKTSLSIKKTRVNGQLYWQVTFPKIEGGRERRTFRNREAAQTYFETTKIQQANYGTAALSITDSLRVEAVECERRLAEFGKTLRDAADFYIAHLRAITRSRKVSEVVAELTAEAPGFVCREVMVELVWVLERAYGHSRGQVAAAIEGLLAAIEIEVEAADDVGSALYRYRDEGFGFADLMIAAAARRAGAHVLVTFDRKAAQMAGVQLIGS